MPSLYGGPAWSQYNTPRFCVDHLLRDEGIAQLSGWTSDAGYALDRILDNQKSFRARRNTTAETALSLQLTRQVWPTVSHRVPINRVVVLNHNFAGTAMLARTLAQDSANASAWNDLQVADPSVEPELGTSWGDARYDACPPDVIDWHLLTAGDWYRVLRYFRLRMEAGASGAAKQEIGELWVTRTLYTDQGPSHTWDNGVVPNVSASETRAGLVRTTFHGEERARFALGWDQIVAGGETESAGPGIGDRGSDLERLRYIRRRAGIRRNTLLYQHPDMGGPTVIDQMDSTVAITGNTTLTIRSGEGPGGRDAVRSTSGAAGATWFLRTPQEPTRDLSDSVLEVWIRAPTASMPDVSAASGLSVTLVSGYGSQLCATQYNLDQVFAVSGDADQWYKIAFDPSTWPDTEQYTIASRPDPVDLSRVSGVVYHWVSLSVLHFVDWGILIDQPKRARPIPCHLTQYQEQQVGRNPSGQLLYDVQMALEEVLT